MRVLPITKTVPPERIAIALQLGLDRFGENRVQEAEQKAGLLESASWELVGHLQSNKAARSASLFETIHSVDSVDLARRLDDIAETLGKAVPIYLQVNIDDDPAKAGFAPADLVTAAPGLAQLARLEFRGLMTVGRLVATPEAARPTFRALRELSLRVRDALPQLGAGLSMGMSDDFEIAVEEGSTVVRLGRVLFGERSAVRTVAH